MNTPNGFTLLEGAIVAALLGILVAVGLGVANGDSIIPNKQSYMDAGGKWSEGIQYGKITQLCTYE